MNFNIFSITLLFLHTNIMDFSFINRLIIGVDFGYIDDYLRWTNSRGISISLVKWWGYRKERTFIGKNEGEKILAIIVEPLEDINCSDVGLKILNNITEFDNFNSFILELSSLKKTKKSIYASILGDQNLISTFDDIKLLCSETEIYFDQIIQDFTLSCFSFCSICGSEVAILKKIINILLSLLNNNGSIFLESNINEYYKINQSSLFCDDHLTLFNIDRLTIDDTKELHKTLLNFCSNLSDSTYDIDYLFLDYSSGKIPVPPYSSEKYHKKTLAKSIYLKFTKNKK